MEKNIYRYHLIATASEVGQARTLAVALGGGVPENTFCVALKDAAGSLFYGADLMASEEMRTQMDGAKAALPSLRWFRMDAQTNELQASSVPAVSIGGAWMWEKTLAACGLRSVTESTES